MEVPSLDLKPEYNRFRGDMVAAVPPVLARLDWRGGPAVEPVRKHPGRAAADVQHGRRLVKKAGRVPRSVPTGTNDRTNERKADLAAVRVPGKHQVEPLPAGPF